MRELERRVVLSVLDRKWREHLYEMDYLREGIYLRAYSQRDPLVEYQREGFDMFTTMMDGIKEESVGFLFNLDVEVEEEDDEDEARDRPGTGLEVDTEPRRQEIPSVFEKPTAPPPRAVRSSGPRASSGRSSRSGCPTPLRARTATSRSARPRRRARTTFAAVGRNALCPCGSGKKYKRCHGAPAADRPDRARRLTR